MTIRDLISKKDYDYIELHMLISEFCEQPIFWGICRSENGKLISLDGDWYSEDDEVVSWEEWSDRRDGIQKGLTVVVEGEVVRSGIKRKE